MGVQLLPTTQTRVFGGPDLKKRRREITEKTAGALITYVIYPAEVQKMTNVQVFNTKAISISVAECA